MRAAFIGLGNMGLGMAHNLVKAGIETVVFDVRPDAVDSVVSAGGTAAASNADAAKGADLVCIAVFNEQQVRDVVTGTESDAGVLATSAPGTVVALHSTISPSLVQQLAAEAARRDVVVIDVAM
ncbi:MAG: garR, partial [Pseudonocardiales bacterium]|nr:garR [Pseudonocardiales bacterium]